MNNKIDITAEQEKIIRQIFRSRLPPGVSVWVFGSRARGNAKKYSDLDLALEHKDHVKIEPRLIFELNSDFEESDLPWTVDILDINDISSSFRQLIDQDKILLNPSS